MFVRGHFVAIPLRRADAVRQIKPTGYCAGPKCSGWRFNRLGLPVSRKGKIKIVGQPAKRPHSPAQLRLTRTFFRPEQNSAFPATAGRNEDPGSGVKGAAQGSLLPPAPQRHPTGKPNQARQSLVSERWIHHKKSQEPQKECQTGCPESTGCWGGVRILFTGGFSGITRSLPCAFIKRPAFGQSGSDESVVPVQPGGGLVFDFGISQRPKHHQPMEPLFEVMLLADALNFVRDHRACELDEFAGVFADQVMMPPVPVDVFVVRMHILIADFLHKPGLGHQIQGAVNRSAADMIRPGSQLGRQVVGPEVVVPRENAVEHNPPRLRDAGVFFLQKINKQGPRLVRRVIFGRDIHLLRVCAHNQGSLP
jgi:hypothetical protein